MRNVVIDVSTDGRYRVVGTGRWAEHGDAWLCAHDLLHHLPTDRGAVHEEIRTFGAEFWAAYPVEGVDALNSDSLKGALTEAFTDRKRLAVFVLPTPPASKVPPDPEVLAAFRKMADEGLCGLIPYLQSRLEEINQRPLTPLWVERIAGQENRERAALWIAAGYESAKLRFPDAAKARAMFQGLESFFNRRRRCQKIKLVIDEANYTWSCPADPQIQAHPQ